MRCFEQFWKKCSSRKATALIPKEEILNNANFFISIWVFDNSVYLQQTYEYTTTILIIICSTQICNILFDFAYAGHKFQKAFPGPPIHKLKTLEFESTCFNRKRGIFYIYQIGWILVLKRIFFSFSMVHTIPLTMYIWTVFIFPFQIMYIHCQEVN